MNLDFTFESQALAVAFTERESIGGKILPNVYFDQKRMDNAFTVWGNCALGLLCWWWHATRRQSTKVNMTGRSAEPLPKLIFHRLSDSQLTTAKMMFEGFCKIRISSLAIWPTTIPTVPCLSAR